MKTIVYKTLLDSIEELKQRITVGCSNISLDTFKAVRHEFILQLCTCQEVEGSQKQHILD